MGQLSAEQHGRRQRNLLEATNTVKRCLFQHRTGGYLAGQVIYNLGEYPARFSIAPTEYDADLLSRFARDGVQLIQFHEEYNDPKRLMGADKFTSHDPDGLRRMVDLIHSHGMKVILYTSACYFDKADPDFDPAWSYPGAALREFYYNYANCSPASPGWRAYLLPRMERLMDNYGVDGLYSDLGYLEIWKQKRIPSSHVSPETETSRHDAALEDLLGMIMNLVHQRGGVFKMHYRGNELPRCRGRVYDYLWVGESVRDLAGLRESTKGYPPYVVPCPDLSRAHFQNEDELYLHAIPYMQFPLRVDGRPVTGERGLVPGIDYGDDFWTEHFKRIHEHYLARPEGPHVYGWWDSPGGRPQARERWEHYLSLYRPMVADDTWCWVEIHESGLFEGKMPAGAVASLFVNEKNYLALANYGSSPAAVSTRMEWQDRQTGTRGSRWDLPPKTLLLLQR